MATKFEKTLKNVALDMDTPLSQSNVSLKLSEIQRRCEELRDEEFNELRLEEAEGSDTSISDVYNPYDRSS